MTSAPQLRLEADVLGVMSALYISMADPGNDQVVRCPRPADAIGAALRGAYGQDAGLPADMARLLQQLDRRR